MTELSQAVVEAHDRAVERREDGYIDPATGNFVFTSAYLARRPCCENGCRHCPWGFADGADRSQA